MAQAHETAAQGHAAGRRRHEDDDWPPDLHYGIWEWLGYKWVPYVDDEGRTHLYYKNTEDIVSPNCHEKHGFIIMGIREHQLLAFPLCSPPEVTGEGEASAIAQARLRGAVIEDCGYCLCQYDGGKWTTIDKNCSTGCAPGCGHWGDGHPHGKHHEQGEKLLSSGAIKQMSCIKTFGHPHPHPSPDE